MIISNSFAPFSAAATCAFKSAIFCLIFLEGYGPEPSSWCISLSKNLPEDTSLKLSMRTPSSSTCIEFAGAEPGVMPPISA